MPLDGAPSFFVLSRNFSARNVGFNEVFFGGWSDLAKPLGPERSLGWREKLCETAKLVFEQTGLDPGRGILPLPVTPGRVRANDTEPTPV